MCIVTFLAGAWCTFFADSNSPIKRGYTGAINMAIMAFLTSLFWEVTREKITIILSVLFFALIGYVVYFFAGSETHFFKTKLTTDSKRT